MFQIMTEAQMREADEQTLRERVRELARVTSVLDEIRDRLEGQRKLLVQIEGSLLQTEETQKRCLGASIATMNDTARCRRFLTLIEEHLRPRRKARTTKRRAKR